ncbi:MAG TPA: DUF2252 domain-containing protein [Gaiellaceae bacterium]|nr:DUF2252 domain-containing protein [Gaiellaceae bacterium]
MIKKLPHLTTEQRAARGRAAREAAPRAGNSTLDPAPERDAVSLLEQQAPSRVQELLPIRYGRMLVSPFTFFRGAANVMAHDLQSAPRSGLTVQLCGDAHLANFGGFASPERSFVFDLNDFDETLPGPFEWDVKRLAASFEVAGRDRGFTELERRTAVLEVVRAYRETMRAFAAESNLGIWYARLDSAAIEAELRARSAAKQAKALSQLEAKARTKDSLKAFSKLTHTVDGEPRIISDPPLITPVRELVDGEPGQQAIQDSIGRLLGTYRRTLQGDRRLLLESYRYVDLARKVVGVGSVGTRCWIVLLLGRDNGDPLFLQVKEAGQSVLAPILGRSRFANNGQRIVEGQRLMQASSDIFLGWIRTELTLDGIARDFYVRQLWDWKASIDLDLIKPQGLMLYAQACGWTLARAHARSGDRIAIASYQGKADVFDRAVADFAKAYADLNERDYQALAEAARTGRIVAQEGV